MFEYREQLNDYLKNRMHAIAPNLTVLVGELIGARLIARAGIIILFIYLRYITKLKKILKYNKFNSFFFFLFSF
jgi:hypothetical protein